MDDRGVIVTCRSCGRKNRIPFSAREAKCGGCKTTLTPPDEPIDVPSAIAFDTLVATASLPIVVDFWAEWCGPCRMVAPELKKVAASQAGRYLVVKVNTEEVPELGNRFGIRSIPTMAVFDRGREVGRTSGARPAADIEAFVEQTLRRQTATR